MPNLSAWKSSKSRPLVWLSGLMLMVLLTACPNGSTSTTQSVTYEFSPAQPTMEQGETKTVTVGLTRTGNYTGGVSFSAANLPAGVMASFPSAPVTGNMASIEFTASSSTTPGDKTFNITANPAQLSSSSHEYTITVTERPVPDPTELRLAPSSSNVEVGDTLGLSASLVYPSGPQATTAVTWSVTAGDEFATVDGGTVTAVAEGTATIQATSTEFPALSATALITVVAVGAGPTPNPPADPIVALDVSPASHELTLLSDPSVTLSAQLRRESGSPVATAGVNWSSDNLAVARVDNSGVVSAIAAGTATITARWSSHAAGDFSGTATITVLPAPAPTVTLLDLESSRQRPTTQVRQSSVGFILQLEGIRLLDGATGPLLRTSNGVVARGFPLPGGNDSFVQFRFGVPDGQVITQFGLPPGMGLGWADLEYSTNAGPQSIADVIEISEIVVSQSGRDSGNYGTMESPYQSIDGVTHQVSLPDGTVVSHSFIGPGDTIMYTPGVHALDATIELPAGVTLTGTSTTDHPILEPRLRRDEAPGGVAIDGVHFSPSPVSGESWNTTIAGIELRYFDVAVYANAEGAITLNEVNAHTNDARGLLIDPGGSRSLGIPRTVPGGPLEVAVIDSDFNNNGPIGAELQLNGANQNYSFYGSRFMNNREQGMALIANPDARGAVSIDCLAGGANGCSAVSEISDNTAERAVGISVDIHRDSQAILRVRKTWITGNHANGVVVYDAGEPLGLARAVDFGTGAADSGNNNISHNGWAWNPEHQDLLHAEFAYQIIDRRASPLPSSGGTLEAPPLLYFVGNEIAGRTDLRGLYVHEGPHPVTGIDRQYDRSPSSDSGYWMIVNRHNRIFLGD